MEGWGEGDQEERRAGKTHERESESVCLLNLAYLPQRLVLQRQRELSLKVNYSKRFRSCFRIFNRRTRAFRVPRRRSEPRSHNQSQTAGDSPSHAPPSSLCVSGLSVCLPAFGSLSPQTLHASGARQRIDRTSICLCTSPRREEVNKLPPKRPESLDQQSVWTWKEDGLRSEGESESTQIFRSTFSFVPRFERQKGNQRPVSQIRR